MAQYRYLPYGTLSNLPVEPGHLTLNVQSIRWELNKPGEATGRLQLAGADPDLIDEYVEAVTPWKNSLYVERDGVLIWGGVVTKALDTDDGAAIDVSASGFFRYFAEKAAIFTDLPQAGWPAPINTLTAMRTLISWWQSVGPAFDLKVVTGTESGGITWGGGPYWRGKDYVYVATAFENVAKLDAFDWEITVAYEGDPPAPLRRLRLWMPRQGRRFDPERSPFWEAPGPGLLKMPWGRDGAKMANYVLAPGAGEAATMQVGLAYEPASTRAGYPGMIAVVPYKDEGDLHTLNRRAAADLRVALDIEVEATVTVRADADPVFGSYTLGDEARFFARTPRFPAGREITKRIAAIELHPDDETVDLDLVDIAA